MTQAKKHQEPAPSNNPKKQTCFVVMPITDPPGYAEGHFKRVYEYIFKPACEAAGYTPLRADDVKSSNYIVLDILQRIVSSDLVLCDLSARNPNVLYELGIRQAFDLPTVLVKDALTERIFDIQGFRTVEYDGGLRVDTAQSDRQSILDAIASTTKHPKEGVNSLITLLGISKAEISAAATVSSDTALILQAVKDVAQRVGQLEQGTTIAPTTREERHTVSPARLAAIRRSLAKKPTLPNGEEVSRGSSIYDRAGGKFLGLFDGYDDEKRVVLTTDRGDFAVPMDDPRYETLSELPF